MIKDIDKQVWRLALPSMLANVTIPLVGIADTAVVGRVGGVLELAGIAIGTLLFDLLYWNFNFLRAGTAAVTAQAFGRKDDRVCGETLVQGLRIAIVSALLVLLLQPAFLLLARVLVDCDTAVWGLAVEYFRVRVWAAPATLSLMVFRGWFIGMQQTRLSMACDLLVNIVNICSSILIAVVCGMGFVGVAWGTVLAQYSGLLLAVCLMLLPKFRSLRTKEILLSKSNKAQRNTLMKLNGNLLLRSLSMQVVYVGFTWLAARHGATELALSAVMMKLFMLYSYLTDGFAYAGEGLVGAAVGSNCDKAVIVRSVFKWSLLFAGLSCMIYGLAGVNAVGWVSGNEELLELCQHYRIWLIVMPLVSCLAFTWDGVFIGLAAGSDLRDCMILSAVGFILTYLCLHQLIGMQALYLSLMVHYAARAAWLSWRWYKLHLS